MCTASPTRAGGRGPANARRVSRARRLAIVASLAIVFGFASTSARAQTVNWDGSTSADWNTGTNWDTNTVPTAADNVTINNISVNAPYIGATVNGHGDNVTVGTSGTAQLLINLGGTLTNNDGTLGNLLGSSGTVTIQNATSQWTNNGALYVGKLGSGTLMVQNGGTVSNVGAGYIGDAVGSSGAVTVTGAGSTWMNGQLLYVGYGGNGTLTISNGGAVSNANGVIGENATSTGGATVTGLGSTWTNAGLYIGESGNGALRVENGGAVNNDFTDLGFAAGAIGTATVTGAGSTLTNTGALAVGENGNGTLMITNGGAVSNIGFGYVGFSASAGGTVTVTGAGSTWMNGQLLYVGYGGNGMLTISNGGAVSNANGGLAHTANSTGTATVTGAGSTWTNAGLYIGEYGNGTLTVEAGGTVNNDFTVLGFAAGAAGTATVTGAGSILTNTGSLNVGENGSGTLTIGAGANVTAGTMVNVADQAGSSGTLLVNGTLIGTGGINVNSGGWIGGSGTVTGDTTVAGAIAPGNSIGTLNIAGNYTQAAGSTYRVEVELGGTSDLIDITGTATLNGGTVKVVPFPDVAVATPYTILTAAGGVTGAYDGASLSSFFVTPALTYDANNVYLTLTQNTNFTNMGLTPNEAATATGASTLPTSSPLWQALAVLPFGDAAAALDSLSGEIHASVHSMLVNDSRFPRQAALDRLRAAFDGVAASHAPILAYAGDGPVLAPAATNLFATWGQAYGTWGRRDGDGNAATITRSSGGVLLGGDAKIAEDWRLGLMGGISRTNLDVDDRASSATADNYTVGAYTGAEAGPIGLRAGAAHTWHDISTDRTVSFPGFADSLAASYKARTAQVFGEAGYRIEHGAARFEPFANVAYVDLHTDGFSEAGGAAALTVGSASQDTTFTTLGLRAETDFLFEGMPMRARGTLGWRHAFGDVTPTSVMNFVGGAPFTIAGVPIARDAAVIETGIQMAIAEQSRLSVTYDGQLAAGAQDHELNAVFAVAF